MKFEASKVWDDAIGLLSGNRELVAIVAGVFFLLPSLAMAVLFADVQAQAMAMIQAMLAGKVSPANPEVLLGGDIGLWLTLGAVAFIVQLIGYMALLALMDPREKPTVGQAIVKAIKAILPLIGAVILFYLGMVVATLLVVLVLGLVVGLIAALLIAMGSETAAGVIGAMLFVFLYLGLFVGLSYAIARLSLILPVIVLGGATNPIRAFTRSWALTRENGWRLLGFYALLVIAYAVISLVVLSLVLGLGAIASSGATGGLIVGLVSALIGAAVSIVFTAIIAAVYHQLRQATPEVVAMAFD